MNDNNATECGAIPPNIGGPIPCHLEPGHDGEHFSTSGCAGSEIRWTDVAEKDREAVARRIWRRRFGDLLGYPIGGPSFAHDEADADRPSRPGEQQS